jgi:hypothetical protein
MHELIEQAQTTGSRRVIRWCALDVMSQCPPEIDCQACALREPCGKRAKQWKGFLKVQDVITQRNRSSQKRFASEMLCRTPSRSDAVFTAFDEAVHVRPVEADPKLMWIGGMDFGIRDPLVMFWAQLRPSPALPPSQAGNGGVVVEVMDEYLASDRTVAEHLKEIAARNWPAVRWVGVDPAGAQRSSHTGQSTIGLLRAAGYKVRNLRWPIAAGLDVIQRRLEGPPGDEPRPTLIIHPRCKQLISAMTRYHFDADRPKSDEPVKDGPDHAVDALRYLLINLENRVGARVRAAGY